MNPETPQDPPPLLRFAAQGMATDFEILFPGDGGHDQDYLERATKACFDELERLEDELSRYRKGSDISRINRLLPGRSVPVGLAAFDCLSLAKAVAEETGGAFDVTVGPLMEVFRHRDGSPRPATPTEIREAAAKTGSHLFEIDQEAIEIRSLGEGLSIDLGGVGKGYALDQMVAVLEEWGIGDALLNAGDSTVLTIGSPPEEEGKGWPVRAEGATSEGGELYLLNRALSGSGFLQQGAHIMDPRKGRPVKMKRLRTWALAPTAAMSDALSTAFSVMKKKEIRALCERHEGIEVLFWEEEL